MAAGTAKEGALPAGHDSVAATRNGLGDERGGTGIANLGAAHGRRFLW
jgi:hypothetical protein